MAQLVIKEEELKQLDTILGEIPTKHGIQLINFFNGVGQKRQQEAQEAQQKIADIVPKQAIPESNVTNQGVSVEAN